MVLFLVTSSTLGNLLPLASWNKNPYLEAVQDEYISPMETDQLHIYYEWRIEFFRWSKSGGTTMKNLGEAWWFAEGGIVRIRTRAYNLGGSVQYCRLYQDISMIGLPLKVGDCTLLKLKAKTRLSNWNISHVYFNGLYDLWFRVVSTYRGITKERDLCIDIAWVTNQPVKHHWIDKNGGFHFYYRLRDARRLKDDWRIHELDIKKILDEASRVGAKLFRWKFNPEDCVFNWIDWGIEIFEGILYMKGSADITGEIDYYKIEYRLKPSCLKRNLSS